MWRVYLVYVSRFFLQPRACTHALSDKISAPTTESKAQTKNCTHQDKIRIVEPDPPCKDWYGHGQWSYSINITQGNVVLVSHIILAPFGNCAPCLHSQRAFFNTSIFFSFNASRLSSAQWETNKAQTVSQLYPVFSRKTTLRQELHRKGLESAPSIFLINRIIFSTCTGQCLWDI